MQKLKHSERSVAVSPDRPFIKSVWDVTRAALLDPIIRRYADTDALGLASTSISAKDQKGNTKLMLAMGHTALEKPSDLIEKARKEFGPQKFREFINARNSSGWSAFVFAACAGSKGSLELLLASGAQPTREEVREADRVCLYGFFENAAHLEASDFIRAKFPGEFKKNGGNGQE